MNNKDLLLFFFFLSSFSFSNEQDADRYSISILTVSPGKDLADAFGHSGIRVIDRELNYDVVFNFGIYDFQAPNFYSNFVKGRPIYSLGINNYNRFLNNYQNQNRGIVEHKIQISNNKKDDVIRLLLENSKQENKFYIHGDKSMNKRSKDSNIIDIENQLMEKIGMRVYVNNKKNNSGTIAFEYKGLDQMERLIQIIKSNY